MIDPSEAIRLESMEQYGFGTGAMKNIKVCRHCGTMSDATESICKECHAPLPQDTLFQIYKSRHNICPKCETVVSDKMQFCPQCGCRVQLRIINKD